MKKLHPGHIEPTKEILSLFLEKYGIIDFTFSPIQQGVENSSFYIEYGKGKRVLRVYRHAKKSEADISFELHFQDLLRKEGVPVPFVYPTVDGEPFASIEREGKRWQAVLMEYVEGSSDTEHYSTQLIKELAAYQARMHLIGIDVADHVLDRPKTKWHDLHDSIAQTIPDASIYSETARAFVERVKAYQYPLPQELPHGYNHLDLYLNGNTIVKDDHIAAILDFDDLEYSPTVACLGFLLWEILFDDGISKVREYLAEYVKSRPLSALEYEVLPHMMFFRNYAISMIELHFLDDRVRFERGMALEKEIPGITFLP